MRKNRIFFDVSSLVDYVASIDRYSGIQRVVVKIISEMERFYDHLDIYICFFQGPNRNYVSIKLSEFETRNLATPAKLRAALGMTGKIARLSEIPALKKYRDNPLKFHFHRAKLDIFASLGMEGRLKKYNLTSKKWRDQRFGTGSLREGSDGEPPRRVEVKKYNFHEVTRAGDHLLILDSSWLDRHSQIFRNARKGGVLCHTLVYDLIPILLPQVTAGLMPLMFYNWLFNSMEYSSSYLTISEATRLDLLDFFKRHDMVFEAKALPLVQQGLDDPLTVVRNTGPLSKSVHANSYSWLAEVCELPDHIRSLSNVPYVLCVGTIEARKNVWRIAQSWKLLLDRGVRDLPRLVFAGRRGWLIDDFEQFLRGTGNLGGWIEIVEGPTDEELAFLYKHCKFTIMASLYEGWGLPVGEALGYGKTCVISSTSSLPEVGKDLVEYCDPISIDSIADACARLIEDEQRIRNLEARIAATQLRSWSDVADDLFHMILQHASVT